LNRLSRLLLVALLAGVALALAARAARAAGYATDDRGRLYRVFPATKEVERIGTVAVPADPATGRAAETPVLTDIALHDEHGMYGISYTDLYRIDLRDPENSRHVGSLGASLSTCNALAFDPDGNLFMAGGSTLYRVDRATGRASALLSFGPAWTSDGDLAWIEDGLYATVRSASGSLLVRLDVAQGRATAVGPIRTEARHTFSSVWGLVFDGRTLWALTPAGEVLELDRKTAVAAVRFTTGVRFWGACPMLRM
jgi:hypothetical protein